MKPLHHDSLVITLEDGTNPFIFFSIKDPKQDYENVHETITSKSYGRKQTPPIGWRNAMLKCKKNYFL
jgi:hypothetical protein